ncbi:MFS general substrate transporter [Marasmius fiardii PR-910]|nr:MFS general substrate transporter [Marasmius fiardii PR-910]
MFSFSVVRNLSFLSRIQTSLTDVPKIQTTFKANQLAGLEGVLRLSDMQYRISLSLTYIPYAVSPFLSIIALRRLGPTYVLPAMTVLSGITTLSTGFVNSYGGLLTCRFFLGLFEGGLFSSIALYLSFLYPRHKLAFRLNFLAASGLLGYAFSGILGYGISGMGGVSNISGWSWTFILEGVFTTLFGISALLLVPNTIQDTRFLSKETKKHLARVLHEDNYGHHQIYELSLKDMLHAFLELHIWACGVMAFTTGVKMGGFAYLLRTVVEKFHLIPFKAQLVAIPPYAAAFLVALLVGYASDHLRVRGVPIGLSNILSVIGIGIFFGLRVNLVRYGCLFIVISGGLSVVGLIMAWVANNSFPYTRRATALAFCGAMFGMGVLLSIWLSGNIRRDTLTVVLLGLAAVEGVLAVINMLWLRRKNDVMLPMRENQYGGDSKWFMYTL